MKHWPALDFPLATDADRILAAVDDFSPTAAEERETGLRVFFGTPEARRVAQVTLRQDGVASSPVDVADEDWARRSQQALEPITVGRITIFPDPTNPTSRIPNPDSILMVITPSMGFGTGHHATTRLCLAALQTIDLTNRFVLDVGTGSGILAIAAARLGAAGALGIDHDPDAIEAAIGNLGLNPEAERIEFHVAALTRSPLPAADIVTANLTGAELVRSADRLAAAVRPGGTLIVSGLLGEEEAAVGHALPSEVIWRDEEDGWVCLATRMPR